MSVTKYKIFESEKKVSDANVGILISKACPSINARHLSRTDCPTNGVTGHKMAKCQGFINLNGFSIRRRPKWTGGSCLIKRNWISSGRHQGCAGQKKNKHHMEESEWGKYLSEKLGFLCRKLPSEFQWVRINFAPQVFPIFKGLLFAGRTSLIWMLKVKMTLSNATQECWNCFASVSPVWFHCANLGENNI